MLEELCYRANELLRKIGVMENDIDSTPPGPERVALIAEKARLSDEYRRVMSDIQEGQD